MATVFTPEDIAALYAPFPLHEHQIREGSRKNGRIQWFVYIDRPTIQRRLDELFPGEWEFISLREHRTESYFTVVAEMRIRGVTRTFNGGSSLRYDDDDFDQDTEKGGMTDAFRRVASVWGLGLYLYDKTKFWTDDYNKGDWNTKSAREKEAFGQFAKWYKRTYPDMPQTERQQDDPEPAVESQPTPQKPVVKKTAAGAKVETPLGAGENRRIPPKEGSENQPYHRDTLWIPALEKQLNAAGIQMEHRKHLLNLIGKLKDEGAVTEQSTMTELVDAITTHQNAKLIA